MNSTLSCRQKKSICTPKKKLQEISGVSCRPLKEYSHSVVSVVDVDAVPVSGAFGMEAYASMLFPVGHSFQNYALFICWK